MGPLVMTSRPHHSRPVLPALLGALVALVVTAAPSAAQYGGGITFTVDPVALEVGGTFDYFGTSCPAASTVTITIDGIPGTLDTTTARDDSVFTNTAIPVPAAVQPGLDYTVRATCAGSTVTTTVPAVCPGLVLPVGGTCPGGSTPTTTSPGGGSGGTNGGGTDTGGGAGTGGGGTGTGTDDNLAFTGAGFAERAVQVAFSLVAAGGMIVLLAGRRRDDPRPVPVRVDRPLSRGTGGGAATSRTPR